MVGCDTSTGPGRTPGYAPLSRSAAAGDELVARSLLQLLVPLLAWPAAALGSGDGDGGAAVAVRTTAWLHIARTHAPTKQCRKPAVLTRPTHRDVIDMPDDTRRWPQAPLPLESHPFAEVDGTFGRPTVSIPLQSSAEDAAWAAHPAGSNAVDTARLLALAAKLVRDAALGRRDVATVAAGSERHTPPPTACVTVPMRNCATPSPTHRDPRS